MNAENTISIKPGHKTGRAACYSDCEETEVIPPPHPDCIAMTVCKECGSVVDYQRVTPGPRIKTTTTSTGAVSVEGEGDYNAES